MPTIITEKGRISVPKTREVNGTEKRNHITVKTSGWVKYRKDGEFHHIPPNQIIRPSTSTPQPAWKIISIRRMPGGSALSSRPIRI